MVELCLIVSKLKVLVIVVLEMWIYNLVIDSGIFIEGYYIFRKDWNGLGGGVCVYIRFYIVFVRRIDIDNDNLDLLWLELWLKLNLLLLEFVIVYLFKFFL